MTKEFKLLLVETVLELINEKEKLIQLETEKKQVEELDKVINNIMVLLTYF
jgi:transcription termination factor NusB